MRFKILSLFIIFLVVQPLPATRATAQTSTHWRKIGSFPRPGGCQRASDQILCAYFLDESRGFISQGNLCASSTNRIFKTTDGGKSWTIPKVPVTGGSWFAYVSSFYMRDSLVGWAAILTGGAGGGYSDSSPPPFSGLWETTNGGDSWYELPGERVGSSIGYMRGKPTAWGGGFAKRDSLTAIRVAGRTNYTIEGENPDNYLTTNGGLSWTKLPLRTFSSNGAYYDPITDQFFICPEYQDPYGRGGLAVDRIYRSSDLGYTWTAGPSFVGVTGHIEGSQGHIYVSGTDGVRYGVWRTDDGGKSVHFVDGPNSDIGTHFSVPPSCDGEVVVDFDSTDVWITTDGGDGTLGQKKMPVLERETFRSISSCSIDSVNYSLVNQWCKDYVIEQVELLTSTPSILGLGRVTIPDTLKESADARFKLYFTPNGAYGDFTGKLHVKGYMQRMFDRVPYDTIIDVRATAKPVGPQVLVNNAVIDLGKLSTCGSDIDTTFLLTNAGCDTVELTKQILERGGYEITDLTLPLRLAPGESVSIPIHLRIGSSGNYDGRFTYTFEQQGIYAERLVTIRAIVEQGHGQLSNVTQGITFAPITICGQDSGVVRFANTGCDTLEVTESLTGDADISAATKSGAYLLAPDSARNFLVRLEPNGKGSRTAEITLHVRYLHGGGSFDTLIKIKGNVIDGTRLLLASESNLEFGTLTSCESRDTVVTLRNTGCDTLTITELTSSLSGSSISSEDLPILLAPGESSRVRVHVAVDTASHPIGQNGILSVRSNSDVPLSPIPLRYDIQYPVNVRLELESVVGRGTSGETARFGLNLKGDPKKVAITPILFSLEYDGDLLTYRSTTSKLKPVGDPVRGATLTKQAFRYDGSATEGSLGEISFGIALSRTDSSPMNLADVQMGSGQSPCLLSQSSEGSLEARYVYRCGEGLIQQYLRKRLLNVQQNYPNPITADSRFATKIPFESLGAGLASIRVTDEAGKLISTETMDVISAGRHFFYFSAESLPAGTYFYQIEFPRGRVIVRRSMLVVK